MLRRRVSTGGGSAARRYGDVIFADSEMELRDAFRVLDAEGNGYIGCKEMSAICRVLGEDLDEYEVYDMVSEAISNFDGRIYYDGFVKILLAN